MHNLLYGYAYVYTVYIYLDNYIFFLVFKQWSMHNFILYSSGLSQYLGYNNMTLVSGAMFVYAILTVANEPYKL